jgi:hypothetical protein
MTMTTDNRSHDTHDHSDDDATDPAVHNSDRRMRQEESQRRRPLTLRSSPRRQEQQNDAAAAAASSSQPSNNNRRRPRLWSTRRLGRILSRRDETTAEDVELLARRLDHGADLLLEKLFAHLSQLPEEEEENGDPLGHAMHQGVSLPAAAVAWLSSQLYPPEPCREEDETRLPDEVVEAEECCSLVDDRPARQNRRRMDENPRPWMGNVALLRDRLCLLRFLLPRVTMIRITRQPWPPELPSKQPTTRLTITTPLQRRPPPQDLNCSTISSVNSALTVEEGTSTGGATVSPRQAFMEYMHRLEHAPQIDLRVFPNTKVLILESVPPSWISNLHLLQDTLQVLRIDRAAFYHNLPRLFFTKPQWRCRPHPPLYLHLTHLRLDRCRLDDGSGLSACLARLRHVRYLSLQHNDIGDEEALKGLRHLTFLTVLDLRYNGLRRLPHANLYLGGQLHVLRLSHNHISSTRGGGLDRCFALRELWLDGNDVQDLCQVSGLARLPELQSLRLHSNPVTTLGSPHFDPGWKVQLWTWFQEERRAVTPWELPKLVDIAGVGSGGALVLGSGVPTEQDWIQIQEGSFSNVVRPPATAPISVTDTSETPRFMTLEESTVMQPVTPISAVTDASFFSAQTPSSQSVSTSLLLSPTRNVRVTKKSRTRRAVIDDGMSRNTTAAKKNRRGGRAGTKTVPCDTPTLSQESTKVVGRSVAFSLQDVLVSLQDPIPAQEKDAREEADEPIFNEDLLAETEQVSLEEEHQTESTRGDTTMDQTEHAWNPFAAYDDAKDGLVTIHAAEEKGTIEDSVEERSVDKTNPPSVAADEKSDNAPEQEVSEADKDEAPGEASPEEASETVLNTTIEQEDRIFPLVRPKMATVKLHKQVPTSTLNVLDCDWDELIKSALEGKIPDGLIKSPVVSLEHSASAVTLETRNGVAKVFSEEVAELLPVDTTESASRQPPSVIQSSGSLSASNPADTVSDRLPNTLPQHIWNDDNSVLSSLGASRDDFASVGVTSKFQMAEENSFYDGPDSCREMKVVENLRLYFEEFVFPDSVPTVPQGVLQELEADHDDWQSITLYFPRLQLWPDDRRRLERILQSTSIQDSDWAENREKFLQLWEEEVIPCGKPALKRLPPNRRIRLGFHGDQLFEGPDLDAYSECRKVLLCLSAKAFYVILREDAVTARHKGQAKQRRFPLPIDKDLHFRDAPWPHSVARHSLLDLEAICIGFEFQRLTLRFRNPVMPKSDPFVYVVLSSNKKPTVKILQELQKAAKELKDAGGTLASEKAPIAIENDSNSVFDALTAAVTPDDLGTVLHYQILQQYWRRGDRGSVRRTCVVTDTKIFLLDEDYTADGHNLSEITVHRDRMADVQYRKVDEATLKQVTEVQGAGTDPRAITIIISGPSTLSRTHRWRLLCRDREGAERLVDDVRKAVSNFDEAESLNNGFAR